MLRHYSLDGHTKFVPRRAILDRKDRKKAPAAPSGDVEMVDVSHLLCFRLAHVLILDCSNFLHCFRFSCPFHRHLAIVLHFSKCHMYVCVRPHMICSI